jgi:hypothetical protein
MNARNENTGPKGLRGWWASPPRSGMRRIIPPFEYRHLYAMGSVRLAVGTILAGLGVTTLVGGSFTAVAVAWAAFFLVLAVLQFLVGGWYLAITRSAAPRT